MSALHDDLWEQLNLDIQVSGTPPASGSPSHPQGPPTNPMEVETPWFLQPSAPPKEPVCKWLLHAQPSLQGQRDWGTVGTWMQSRAAAQRSPCCWGSVSSPQPTAGARGNGMMAPGRRQVMGVMAQTPPGCVSASAQHPQVPRLGSALGCRRAERWEPL